MPIPVSKIGVLALAEPDHGGVFQYTQAVIDALVSVAPGKVVVLSPSPHHYKAEGAEFRHFALPAASNNSRFLRLLSAVSGLRLGSFFSKLEMDGIGVILSPSPSLFPIWMDLPFVTTVHDFQERYFPAFFSFRERIRRRTMNRLIGRASRFLLCESSFVRGDLMRFAGVPDVKIRVVPAPPPKDLKPVDQEAQERVRKKFGLGQSFLYYPAQFWPHKNHERAMETLKLLEAEFPNLELVLSGAKKAHFEKAMVKARDLGIAEKVRYVGYVTYDELAALYQMSRALFMPSLFESISIPVYEAFSLGTAVCAARVTGIPDQVGDAAVLFDPLSVDDMVRALALILRDPKFASELAKKGRERLSSLTYESYGTRLLEVLAEAEAAK